MPSAAIVMLYLFLFIFSAAITALNARNIIPKRPIAVSNKLQINQRSFIPKPFASKVVQNVPAVPANSFPFPARQMTVNGVEKSGIPRPQFQPQFERPVTQRTIVRPAGINVFLTCTFEAMSSALFQPNASSNICIFYS